MECNKYDNDDLLGLMPLPLGCVACSQLLHRMQYLVTYIIKLLLSVYIYL
jgi:hypothetical protein